jgi:hypothetical protein
MNAVGQLRSVELEGHDNLDEARGVNEHTVLVNAPFYLQLQWMCRSLC